MSYNRSYNRSLMRDLVIGSEKGNGKLIYIPKDLRSRHLYILGRTGAGKSSLLHRCITQDAKRGHAIVLFDAGDLATDLVETLPDEALDRVYFFSLEKKMAIPYNPILRRRDEPGRLENELFDLIDQTTAEASNSTNLSARMKRILSEALREILKEKEPTLSTLVTHLLEHKEEIAKRVDLSKAEFTLSLEGVIDRLSLFLRDERVRRVLCGGHELNFDEIIDQAKILLISLAGLEKPLVRFLGTLLFNGLESTILERSEAQRRTIAIYIDEFQDYLYSRYAVHNFQTLFAQGRRYKVSLCVAHQDFGTIDSNLLHTIHANAASIISFSCGPTEATKMNKIFNDHDNPGFLPDYYAISRVGQEVCSIMTYPPPKKIREILGDECIWSDEAPSNPLIRPVESVSKQTSEPISVVQNEVKQDEVKLRTNDDLMSQKNKTTDKEESALKGKKSLPLDEELFIKCISKYPNAFVTDIYEQLQLSGYKGNRIKERMIEEGLIEQTETRQGAGGRLAKVLKLTEKGTTILKAIPLTGKGGDRHKQMQRMIKEQAELYDWKAKIEERIPGSKESVDVGLTKGEVSVAVEISDTTKTDQEIQNIRKCLDAGYDYIVCISSDERRLGLLKTEVKKSFTARERERIRFYHPSRIKEFLSLVDFQGIVSEKGIVSNIISNQKQLMNTKEAAEFLGISKHTLYEWVIQKKIPYVKVGRLTKFKVKDLEEWLTKRSQSEDRRSFL